MFLDFVLHQVYKVLQQTLERVTDGYLDSKSVVLVQHNSTHVVKQVCLLVGLHQVEEVTIQFHCTDVLGILEARVAERK